MQLGFSIAGVVFLLMLFAPNIKWAKNQPLGYDELAWARYFKGGGELTAMYAPLGLVPVPLATLPVAALALLGVWCQSPPIILAAVILGIGHIGIHLGHLRELSNR